MENISISTLILMLFNQLVANFDINLCLILIYIFFYLLDYDIMRCTTARRYQKYVNSQIKDN